VVLVDDSSGFRRAAESFLHTLTDVELAGSAADGAQGLALVSRLRPDTAIIDITMPDMSGFEVAARLREAAHSPAIILVSLNVDASTRCEAARLGVDAVLPKSDFVQKLPEVLGALLRKRGARGQS
jgi:DNA-binding NarL/FixJ family response regulator